MTRALLSGAAAIATLAALAANGSGAALAQTPSAGGSPGLPSLVARVRASILPVGTYSPTASPRFGFRGSGFVIGDGHLLVTNAHVLPAPGEGESTQRLAVLAQTAASGREAGDLRFATLVSLDRVHDLAILRLDGPALPALAIDERERALEGEEIVLIGFPVGGALGFAPVTHKGLVASITTVALPAPTAAQLDPRAVSRLREGNFEAYQLDATAYPGNSGGPVLHIPSGRVVAVVNMVLVRGSRESALSAPTGITYAIPARYLRSLAEEARTAPPAAAPATPTVPAALPASR